MIDFDEDHLAEVTAALAERWGTNAPKISRLDAQDEAIAAKLLGSAAEAQKLSATPSGGRYRYRPQTVSAIEFWHTDSMGSVYLSQVGWNVDAVVNGRRRNLFRYLDDSRCGFILDHLERLNYRTKMVMTESMKVKGITRRPVYRGYLAPMKPVAIVAHTPEPPRKPHRPSKHQQPSRRFAIMEELKEFRW